jgi:hypothetical protein
MRQMRRRRVPELKRTTVRDFGGGLNVIDTELNLTSRYSPVFDNTIRYADGSVGPRYGYEMWLKLHNGVEVSGTLPSGTTIETVNTSEVVLINWTAHPFTAASIAHIRLSGLTAVNGIPAAELNALHGVRYVNANQIAICVRTRANATGSGSIAGAGYTRDTHALGGRVVEGLYFNNYLIVISEIGEIIRIDETRTIQRIWSYTIAHGLGGSPLPWRASDAVASDYWSGSVILSNGIDKPLIIDFTKTNIVDYLVDPGNSNSNVEVPAFDLCKSAFRYFVVRDTDPLNTEAPTQIRLSTKNAAMVFSGAPDAGDAVDIDIAKIVATAESTLTGLALIKNTLMVIMPTTSVLLTLGNYIEVSSTQVHEPVPSDVMPNFGTSGPRTVVEVGNDVFMLDYAGVPSARLSQAQNTIVPVRVSELVEPMMSAHLGRLSNATMKRDAFGIFDIRNRSIHFYAPKFDPDDQRALALNPFTYTSILQGTNTIYMSVRAHSFEIGDRVTVSGATDVGPILAASLNGERRVVGIISEDVVLVEFGGLVPLNDNRAGGGGNVVIRPISDETIGYIYHYVPSLRINAWSRFRGINLRAGCTSSEGRAFFFTENQVLRYGSVDEPVYGDFFGDFQKVWANSTAYTIGELVRDTVTGQSFECLVNHTSLSSGTFAEDRNSDFTRWKVYEGIPISMEWELPWADFDERQLSKALRHIHFDAKGTARFKVEAYVDYLYRRNDTGALSPISSIEFVGGDSGGYGAGDQPFGGGRRTREQLVWPLPVRFKILKLRLTSQTTRPLRISSVSFMYHVGSLIRT